MFHDPNRFGETDIGLTYILGVESKHYGLKFLLESSKSSVVQKCIHCVLMISEMFGKKSEIFG